MEAIVILWTINSSIFPKTSNARIMWRWRIINKSYYSGSSSLRIILHTRSILFALQAQKLIKIMNGVDCYDVDRTSKGAQ
jgi:hypothetical protein